MPVVFFISRGQPKARLAQVPDSKEEGGPKLPCPHSLTQCIPKLSFPPYIAIFPRPRTGRGPSLSLDFNLPGIWGLCPRPRAHSDPCVQRQGRLSLFLGSYQCRSSYQRLWGPEVREGATRPVDFSQEGQEVGSLGTPIGSPACFLFLRWHCISEEPPQRTLGDEDTPGNKLRRMKLYLFLALKGKPYVLLWPSLDMPCLFPPPSLSTGCTTCLKCLPLFCLSFKAQLQACLSRKVLCLFQPTETSFSIQSSSCSVCLRNTTFRPMACVILY